MCMQQTSSSWAEAVDEQDLVEEERFVMQDSEISYYH